MDEKEITKAKNFKELDQLVRSEIAEGNQRRAIELLKDQTSLIVRNNPKLDSKDLEIGLSRALSLVNQNETDNLEGLVDEVRYQQRWAELNFQILQFLIFSDQKEGGEIKIDEKTNLDELKNEIIQLIEENEFYEVIPKLRAWIDFSLIGNEGDFQSRLDIIKNRYSNGWHKYFLFITGYDEYYSFVGNITKELITLTHNVWDHPYAKNRQLALKNSILESAQTFVDESIMELKERERELKQNARFWYICTFCTLAGSIGVSFWFFYSLNSTALESTGSIVLAIIKSVFIVGLLIALARYSFMLGKTYMNESLKNADRIHAINFGKFYMQVYGAKVEPKELKEVFKDWNMYQESPFNQLNGKDFDPEIWQKMVELMQVMQGGKK